MEKKNFIGNATVALFDQALLSGLNFLIGYLFISLASKAEYGVYTQLFNILLLFVGIQNAIVNSPLTSLGPKKTEIEQQSFIVRLFRFHFFEVLLLAIIVYIGISIVGNLALFTDLKSDIALPFAFALFGTCMREFQRNLIFLRLRAQHVFVLDIFYFIFIIFGLFLTRHLGNGTITAVHVFSAVGLANCLATVLAIVRFDRYLLLNIRQHGSAINEVWSCGRWALPGVLLTWGFSNSFVFIAAFFGGTAAAADISAARLFLMPFGMLFVAWSQVFRPRASRWLTDGRLKVVEKVAIYSMASFSFMVVIYSMTLLLSFGWLEDHVLGEQYLGLAPLVLLWGGVFLANCIRLVGTSCLLSAVRFKELFHFSAISFIVSLPLSIILAWLFGRSGPLWGLIVSEVLLSALIWQIGWRVTRREFSGHITGS